MQPLTLTLTLPAGASTLSIIYDSSMGSAGYLNLDYVEVTP